MTEAQERSSGDRRVSRKVTGAAMKSGQARTFQVSPLYNNKIQS